ncbi:Hypothetical predicted protein [Lecanosticta acicola]|uniref:Uncharacterized protein n=1 Tax=Lecanosticta acicola TaxID=111012 RepID=A0AAI8W1I6_9PEZI|nr:Hypothetical predicted protein [Lecanosticta acicola]
MSLQKFLPSQNMDDGKWVEDRVVTNGEQAYRGSFRKTRMKGYTQDIEVGEQETPDLKHWCQEFGEDRSWLKIFRVERRLLGLNEQEIREGLEDLVRSTHYRGHLDISFPVGDRNVDIYSPHWINRARISWVRWIFYLTFLWIITWPILFFMTKRWEAFSVCWKFSSPHRGGSGRNVLTWASLRETQWLQKHRNLLLNLVLEKFEGDGTDLPTEVEVRRGEVNTGNANMNSALRFMQGGADIWNSVSGQGGGRAGSEMGWGMDSRY